MKSLLAVVLLLLVLAMVGVLLTTPWNEPGLDLRPEPHNVGTATFLSLPSGLPLNARLFLSTGEGTGDNPYVFCRISYGGDGTTCLFTVALQGGRTKLQPRSWYLVTAAFPREQPLSLVTGTLLEALPANDLPVIGRARDRQSRFAESSESLSNWAAQNQVHGYLRLDGIYVWYLSDEALASASWAGIGPINSIWSLDQAPDST